MYEVFEEMIKIEEEQERFKRCFACNQVNGCEHSLKITANKKKIPKLIIPNWLLNYKVEGELENIKIK